MKTATYLLLASLLSLPLVAAAADADTKSEPTCPKGMKLVTYDEPREGTKPLKGKHARCESTKVECPRGTRAAYYDTEILGSTAVDGRFVRCEDATIPSGGKPE